ncbi:ATP-binding protein [Streptomyces oceani]|uniref:Histidine kinase/HSP90-like ATPase domain-containing protein n=1 Tax=Streptomyces oceani TaxID=1075402 RepID=A0A1E7KK96_9ACTN|nr:ATP-binding protein [Streptomyces oceani]OEV04358.1 hypothetical protein AN216_07835 [Streptomyces oceani]
MTSETTPLLRAEHSGTAEHFSMAFSSTPRGARLARRLAGERLNAWGVPYGGDAHDTLALIVGELAANATWHGWSPGRDCHLALTMTATTVRVEVTDSRPERPPRVAAPAEERDTGRGLLLVDALASCWGWRPHSAGVGKTVWAEYTVETP